MSKTKEKAKNKKQKDFDSILEFLFGKSDTNSLEKIKLYQDKKEARRHRITRLKKLWFVQFLQFVQFQNLVK